MAEIEYSGIKVSGSKLLFVIPLLGTLGGALWGGFEMYKDYTNMKSKISKYVAPDLSGIDARLDLIQLEFDTLKEIDSSMESLINEQINSVKLIVSGLQSDVHDIKMELKDDIASINESLDKHSDKLNSRMASQDERMDKQDERNRNNVEDVRGIINSFEIRMDRKIDTLNEKIDTLEEDLDKKIRQALSNPLING